MCAKGDPLPGDRRKRPYVPVLRELKGKQGVGVRMLADTYYATLSHYRKETREYIRHTTRDEPCSVCLTMGKPRWTGWIYVLHHDERKPYLLPFTDTAVEWCPEFKQAAFEDKLLNTDWRFWRKNGK